MLYLVLSCFFFFFFKQKTAYEIYQCDWSSDVCSSDLVSRQKQDLRRVEIAIPGEYTSAFLTLKIYLGDFKYRVMPFDQIMPAVKNGDADAGLDRKSVV